MSKSASLLLIVSGISAMILWVLMDTYKEETEVIVDNILFIGCIIIVGGWILSFISGIFVKVLPESKPVRVKKLKQKKNNDSKELTPIQFILFLPIATFSMLLLLGLFSSGFKP